jgi:PKD repeat protein
MVVGSVALFVALAAGVQSAAFADTAPADESEPKTVSADALPTLQIDGVAWTQVVVGNTVYVGGDFQTARPSGAAPGVGTTNQAYLLAYDIRTGALINSFRPTLNGQVLTIAASPDGSRVYVGGDFTTVNGSNRHRLVALDTSNGSVVQSFYPQFNARVQALVLEGETLYVGGNFTQSKGQNRTRLAALRTSDAALLDWTPTAGGGGNWVTSLAMSSDKSKLVVGGRFTQLNGATQLGLGAVDKITGATLPWDAANLIKNSGTNAGITSLNNSDGVIYGTGFVFGDGQNGFPKGNLEAVFAADSNSGQVRWVADCHGDHYSAFGLDDSVYTVGHAHQCHAVGGFPQTNPWTFSRALAFSKDAVGVNKQNTDGGYFNFGGVPAPRPLNWYPDLVPGKFTGQTQAAWNVTGNSDFLVLGGEFTFVNGQRQQGLTRFARVELAPNKEGPRVKDATTLPTLNSPAAGLVRGRIQTNWDRDNENLTYNVFRSGIAQPIYTTQVRSTFWNRPWISFSDTNNIVSGETYRYRVQVVDPHGNTYTPDWTSVVGGAVNMSDYGLRVLNDDANTYYRLNEPSGANVNDAWGANNGMVVGNVTRGVDGAIQGDTDKAYRFPGTMGNFVRTPNSVGGSQKFAVEAWFKTDTTRGGKIVGFGNGALADSTSYDRHIYMQNNGKLTFGVYPGQVKAVSSTDSYNNNQWHHVVAQLSDAGMQMYVDGALVATDVSVTSAQTYNGYWRIGGDNLNGWTNQPSSAYFNGEIDDVAIYDEVLSQDQVSWHWSLSGHGGPPPNALPTAVFTSTAGVNTASFDASGSTDEDGTISSYEWDFGDGQVGTGVAPTHNYAVGGTYTVSLKVTDNLGGVTTLAQEILVLDPPLNQAPVATFNAVGGVRTVSVDATASTDSDGSIATYEWNFGDGATKQGLVATHQYEVGGTYDVTLRVTDDDGAVTELTKSVLVTDPAPNQVPVAAFAATGGELTASFNAGASTDVDGTLALYSWDFGDGQTGSGVTTSHGYDQAGTYSVKLTVTDNDGAESEITQDVVVNPLNQAIAFDDFARAVQNGWGAADKGGAWTASGSVSNFGVSGDAGVMTVPAGKVRTQSLNALSTTTTDTSVTVRVDRPTGGSSFVSVVGRKVGNSDYRVKLRYSPNGDVFATVVRVVNGTETVLGGGKVNGLVVNNGGSLQVRFQADGTGTTQLRAKVWKSGDAEPGDWFAQTTDSTPALQNPGSIAFQTYVSGRLTNAPYTVTFDNLKVASSVAQTPNQAPVAQFTATPGELSASFNASQSTDSDGTIASYDWDFGDGNVGFGVTATHGYQQAGTYAVKLRVTDNDGAIHELEKSVTVTAPTPPVAVLASDNFSRSEVNGWGASDQGGAWTRTGSAANFAVENGAGVLTIPSGGQTRTMSLNGLDETSTDTAVDVTLARPTVGSSFVSVIGRKVDNNSGYRVKLRYYENGNVAATLVKMVGGTETSLGGGMINSLTFNSGETLRVRLQVVGDGTTGLKAKVWKALDKEPTSWTVQANDSTASLQAKGGVAFQVYASGSIANLPYLVKFDNLSVRPGSE